mgnify:CR=1 FL=1
MKNKLANKKAITLISLVITIIVLLILAGVTVSMITSQDGILNKAINAKSKMEEAKIRELNELNELNNLGESEVQKKYTVTFCDYNGTELKKVKVNEGETATYTEMTPTRMSDENYNYTFSRWITSINGYTEADLTNVQSDMTVYALYNTQKVCFSKGTKVLSETGLINIEEIKKGMRVFTYNEETQKIELNEVNTTFINYVDCDMCKIYINNEVIESTNKHPYYIKGKGWTEAKDLKIGDMVITSENKEIRIDNIEIIKHQGNELQEVYNLEVQNNHNYFVGESKILVHNITTPVASIGGITYTTIQSALNAAKTGETIILMKDTSIDNSTVCGTSGEYSNNIELTGIIIDLNAKNLSISSGNNMYLRDVDIKNGKISISENATFVMDNNCNLQGVEIKYN